MRKWQDKITPGQPQNSASTYAPGDEPPSVIILVTGEDTDGQPQWAYVKIPAQKYVPFKKAEEKGNYNLSDFGAILKSGKGKAPSDAVKAEMHEKFGCEEDFETSLAQMMEEAIAAWNEVLPVQSEDDKS